MVELVSTTNTEITNRAPVCVYKCAYKKKGEGKERKKKERKGKERKKKKGKGVTFYMKLVQGAETSLGRRIGSKKFGRVLRGDILLYK